MVRQPGEVALAEDLEAKQDAEHLADGELEGHLPRNPRWKTQVPFPNAYEFDFRFH